MAAHNLGQTHRHAEAYDRNPIRGSGNTHMRRIPPYGFLALVAALGGCADNAKVVAPTDDRVNWDWDAGLRTFGGGPAVLICSPTTVAFNGTVSCSLANVGPFNFPTWRFLGFGGVPVDGPNGMGGWSGPMVLSGDVIVDYVDDFGQQQTEYQPITVTRRTWSWASLVGGQQGTPNEIDSCFLGEYALTASLFCTATWADKIFHPRPDQLSNGTGYAAASVPGSGPNHGLWYVASASADMDLRTQVRKWYRSDGPGSAMFGSVTVTFGCSQAFPTDPNGFRNVHTVNNVCVVTPAFNSFVNCLWSHEGQHLSTATTSAQSSANNVYALWEPMVATTSSGLQNIVSVAYSSAHDRVRTTSQNAENTMTQHPYTFWDYIAAGGWQQTNETILC